MKHLKCLYDLSRCDVEDILSIAADLKKKWAAGERPPLLAGRVLTQVFDKPSLRTRVSFEAAMTHLGGDGLFLSSQDAGLRGRESLPDVARVLSSYCDVIVLRTFSQALIDEFAQHSRCPVINGLSDDRHPCQALTDLLTVQEVFGVLADCRLVFVGDGNNMAASLAIATALMGMPITVCTPRGYQLDQQFVHDLLKRIPTADVTQTTDPQAAVADAAIIYSDVWASMGQESEAAKRKKVFAPYQINAALFASAPKECRFMHCLPAHRGDEVTDEIVDGSQSIVFEQAENRMHLAKGLLVWLLNGHE